MPQLDDNAPFIWAIFAIGLVMPALLCLYAGLRARFAKRRLERLKAGRNA